MNRRAGKQTRADVQLPAEAEAAFDLPGGDKTAGELAEVPSTSETGRRCGLTQTPWARDQCLL